MDPQTAVTKPHAGGRPVETITDEVVTNLVASFQRGMSVTVACENAGISRRIFYYHKENNKEFCDKITKAQNLGKNLAGDIILDVLWDFNRDKEAETKIKKGEKLTELDGPKYPVKTRVETSRWYLERKDPEAFSTRPDKPTEGPTTNNTQNNYFFLDDGKLADIANRTGLKSVNPLQLLEALKNANMGGSGAEESTAPVVDGQLQDQHPEQESVSPS